MKNILQFVKADKDLFAVYQTIYSQADMEMWYDWAARLDDTKWSEDCYFLYRGDEKIGGLILSPNFVIYPFLIAPFCDKQLYWKLVLSQVKSVSNNKEIHLRGIPSLDVNVLLSFGGEIWRPRQIMCRPTDTLKFVFNDDYSWETPKQNDIPEMAEALRKSFLGGIVYHTFGEDSIEKIVESMNNCYTWYTNTNTWNHTVAVKDKKTGAIVGCCLAGIHPEMVHKFAFIDDMFVLPEHRGKGLAKAMLRYSITAAHKDTAAIKLHVLKGNPAEQLYLKSGFIPGPSFTDMKYTVNKF